MAPLRASLRLATITLYTLPLMPLQWLGLRLGWGLSRRLPVLYHRGLCRLLGLRIERFGPPLAEGPALLVANHASWLDITVLSSLAPLAFVSRHDVADWPVFGTLARLQRTVFVERRRTRTVAQRDAIAARLAAGERLVLFAEGTSNDGNRVLPFKSGLFAAAELPVGDCLPAVQPISVAYTHANGLPLGRRFRHYYAWYGDMRLLPHLWRVLQQRSVRIEVQCHAPVSIADFASRKALAEHCRAVVSAGLVEALTGRRTQAAVASCGDLAAVKRA